MVGLGRVGGIRAYTAGWCGFPAGSGEQPPSRLGRDHLFARADHVHGDRGLAPGYDRVGHGALVGLAVELAPEELETPADVGTNAARALARSAGRRDPGQ